MRGVLQAFLLRLIKEQPRLALIHNSQYRHHRHMCNYTMPFVFFVFIFFIFIFYVLLFDVRIFFMLWWCSRGSPLFWIGVGVGLSALFSWVRTGTLVLFFIKLSYTFVDIVFLCGTFFWKIGMKWQVATYLKVGFFSPQRYGHFFFKLFYFSGWSSAQDNQIIVVSFFPYSLGSGFRVDKSLYHCKNA